MEISDIKVGLRFRHKDHPCVGKIESIHGDFVDVGKDFLGGSTKDILGRFNGGNWVVVPDKEYLLAQIAELQKQVEEIEKKEEEKYFDFRRTDVYITDGPNGFSRSSIEVREAGELKNKGFYLDERFNWEIVTDSEDVLVLVPTKKQ